MYPCTISICTQKVFPVLTRFFCSGQHDSYLYLSTVVLLLKSPVENFKSDSGNASSSHRISTIICERFPKISKGLLVGTPLLALSAIASTAKTSRGTMY